LVARNAGLIDGEYRGDEGRGGEPSGEKDGGDEAGEEESPDESDDEEFTLRSGGASGLGGSETLGEEGEIRVKERDEEGRSVVPS
jgi:hypothetical protein